MNAIRMTGAVVILASAVFVGSGQPGQAQDAKGKPATQTRKNVAVFIHDGVELLDFAGPGEVFAAAGSGRAFKVFTVAADARPITSQGFLKVIPNHTFADCPKPDLIVLPGGATQRGAQGSTSR